jgi:hypothetical protein
MLAASRIGRTVAAAGIFLSLAAHGPAGAQDVGHVAIIRLPAASYAPEDWNTRAAAARAFFASHADGYDFLVVFPAVPVEIGAAEGAETLGRHYGVRNAVSGIGVAPFDGGGQTGSPGRLKGYVDVYSLVPGLAQAGFDAALATTAHEIAHLWSGMVGFRDPATGSRSGAILGADGAHWSFYLDSDASVLYGSDWRDAGGGTFVADASMRRYSALDLYLMGFRDPAEVPDFALLQPAGTPPHPAEAPPPPNGPASPPPRARSRSPTSSPPRARAPPPWRDPSGPSAPPSRSRWPPDRSPPQSRSPSWTRSGASGRTGSSS